MTQTDKAPTAEQIEVFRAYVEEMERANYVRDFPQTWNTIHSSSWTTHANTRRKYIAIDVGTSGHYLVDRKTGEIWGIKGYGKKHDGYFYGHVQNPNDRNWPGAAMLVTGKQAKRGEGR